MLSFIDKFLGLVKGIKNIAAGKKKESQEPEVIHEITHESELNVHEPEPQPESHESESQLENHELQPESHEFESHEPQEQESESSPERKYKNDEYDYTYISQKIRNIITQHYSYSGFAINDTSGYSRFRTYARDYELSLPESDSELRRLIVSSGTLIEGNVYVFSNDDVNRMLREVQRLIDEGNDVIYYRDFESFIDESNLYYNLSNIRAVREILRDNYEGYIFTGLFMESESGHKAFRSYMDGLRYILAKYFPDGFNSDYALLRKYAEKENVILSGNDKALKRETEALKE